MKVPIYLNRDVMGYTEVPGRVKLFSRMQDGQYTHTLLFSRVSGYRGAYQQGKLVTREIRDALLIISSTGNAFSIMLTTSGWRLIVAVHNTWPILTINRQRRGQGASSVGKR